MNETVLNKLEQRLGRLHARQRLGIETDQEAQIFGQGINFFHIENWYSIHSVIRTTLKLLDCMRAAARTPSRSRANTIMSAARGCQNNSTASRYFISAIYTRILAKAQCDA
jgi:hypothetical protein